MAQCLAVLMGIGAAASASTPLPPTVPREAQPRTVERPGGVEEHRAQMAETWSAIAREHHRVGEALVATPGEEQLRRLRDQTCSECPGGRSLAHRAGVAVTLDQTVAFDDLDPRRVRSDGAAHGVGFLRALPDATMIWTGRVVSPGAERISVTFEELDLPPGAELYFYTDEGAVDGPYTARGGLGTGSNWSVPLSGDELGIELRFPADLAQSAVQRERLSFTIASVNHFGDGTLSGRRAGCPNLAPCQDAASCYHADHWSEIQALRTSAAHLIYERDGSFYVCSGNLINSSDANAGDYLLTANHCFADEEIAETARFFWDFTKSVCPSLQCNDNAEDSPNQQGSSILYTHEDQDVTLLELDETPPGTRTYLGWTTEEIAEIEGLKLHRVHHPGGAPQMYTEHAIDTSPLSEECLDWGKSRGDYVISRNTLNAAEAGSSGSVAVTSNNQIVGQLSGGCGPPDDEAGYSVCRDQIQVVDGAFAAYFLDVAQWIAPPLNNSFPGTSISGPSGGIMGTTVGASREDNEPLHGNLTEATGALWYNWTAPHSETVAFNTCVGSDINTAIAVYTGRTIGALTPVAFDNNSCGEQSLVTFEAEEGRNYRIAVVGADGSIGAFTLSWAMENVPDPEPELWIVHE